MSIKKPPFDITARMITDVAEIAESVGKLTSTQGLSASPELRRTHRMRTIHASLAIEQNSLSLEQVTAVINGKAVIAPPKDIAEVQNAYEIYEKLDQLNPYSLDDLLFSHSILMKEILPDAGFFRIKAAGVADTKGAIVHFGTLARYIPELVSSLMDWMRETDCHPLIKSCVFHYEFEVIHPFLDGNGRLGRLWHTLLLSQWNPIFSWLPVETIIRKRQQEYYRVINQSNESGNSTVFIEFMLSAIKETLTEAIQYGRDAGLVPDKITARRMSITNFLATHEHIMNADVCRLCGVSAATANRILNAFVSEGLLEKGFNRGHWAYKLNDQPAT